MGLKRILEEFVRTMKDFRQLDPHGHPADPALALSLAVILGVYVFVAYRMGFRDKTLRRRRPGSVR